MSESASEASKARSARRLAISQEADARPWSWQCIHKEDDE